MPTIATFEPVDATRIPPALAHGRARMVINALHHFPPEFVPTALCSSKACFKRKSLT